MEVKELLQEVKPLLRAKASVDHIERKIANHTKSIESLEKQKTEILDAEYENEDEVLDRIEAWADSLPKDLVANSEIRELLKALEYLNK